MCGWGVFRLASSSFSSFFSFCHTLTLHYSQHLPPSLPLSFSPIHFDKQNANFTPTAPFFFPTAPFFPQVTAVVLAESIAREESPDKPVSTAVVATGVVKGSTFAVNPSSLSPDVESQLEIANNQTTACPSTTPDICSADGGGNVCVDFTKDRNNCGSCVNACPAAQSSVSGACSCPSATPNFCAAVGCVDFTQDSNNCGSCGNACPAAQSCVSGACSCPSATPNFCAAIGSVDFTQDRNNCGSCCNVCPATQSCVSGTCSCQATDDATLRACLAAAVPGGGRSK